MHAEMEQTKSPYVGQIPPMVAKRVLLWAGREGRLPDLNAITSNPAIPAGVAAMLRRCLCKDMNDRPSAEQLCALAESIFNGVLMRASRLEGANPDNAAMMSQSVVDLSSNYQDRSGIDNNFVL
jgi:hypothetical protein